MFLSDFATMRYVADQTLPRLDMLQITPCHEIDVANQICHKEICCISNLPQSNDVDVANQIRHNEMSAADQTRHNETGVADQICHEVYCR